MKQSLYIVFFLFGCESANCQRKLIEKVDTIQIHAKILFIDSLCDMTSINSHFLTYKPYYLVLVETDQNEQSMYGLDHRIAIRTNNIEPLLKSQNLTLSVKKTKYKNPLIKMQKDSIKINKVADSIFDQIDKTQFVISYFENTNCMDYSIKEKVYFKYELIE